MKRPERRKKQYDLDIKLNIFENRKSGMIESKPIHKDTIYAETLDRAKKPAADIAKQHIKTLEMDSIKNWFIHSMLYMTRSYEQLVGRFKHVYYVEVRERREHETAITRKSIANKMDTD